MFDLSSLALPEGSTVIDCGTNTGQFLDCLFRVQSLRAPRVFGIEMLPDLARCCRLKYPGVTVLNCAVGEYDEWVEYRRYHASVLSSVLSMNEECPIHCGETECQEVEVGTVGMMRLDAIAALLMLDGNVDLLKVDVQGLELQALRGGLRLLERTRNVIVEAAFVPTYNQQATASEMDEFMCERGFHVAGDLLQHTLKQGVTIAVDRWYSR